jgi:hypothetical protein
MRWIGLKWIELESGGRFLSPRRLKREFAEVLAELEDLLKIRVVGGLWQEREKKLHVIAYDHLNQYVWIYTFEV